MKVTVILLLAFSLRATPAVYAQRISLSVTEAPIDQVFKEIEKQTSFKFFFDENAIKKANKITIRINDGTLEQILKEIFIDQPLDYKIVGNTIAVNTKKINDKIQKKNNGQIVISGKVSDDKGIPMPGVSVKLKGTNKATQTNNNGEYRIEADRNSILVFSYLGYKPREIHVNNQAIIILTLQEQTSDLDQVQVIAYGVTSKRLNTGNTNTITVKDIEKQPVSNPLLALQGRVPGLNITQTTGLPGTGVTVRIQGQNSMLRGNDPYYVVDGVPYPSQMLPSYFPVTILGGSGQSSQIPSGQGNPLSFINPADIESITILKDADATAIYGSRAANGAILITTKKGIIGRPKVDVNIQQGYGKMTRRLDLLNTEQYLELRREAKRNNNNQALLPTDYDLNGTWEQSRYTDWQDVILGGTAGYTDVNASLSGGSGNTQFLFGTAYHREGSVFPGDLTDRKISARMNLNHRTTDQKFQANFTLSYLRDDNKLMEDDLTGIAMRLAPNAPALYNTDGSLNWAPLANGNSTWRNPLAYINTKYTIQTGNILGNVMLNYHILPHLELKGYFGFNEIRTDEKRLGSNLSIVPERRATIPRISYFNNTTTRSWNLEPQISYSRDFAVGKINLLLGGTMQRNDSQQVNIQATGFSNDLVMGDIKAAASFSIPSSLQSTYKYNAVFGRINYNYADKYLINLTARRDASSRFGIENMVHDFGAIGTAWVFSEEHFFKNNLPFLSYGKLQSSYGLTGNDQIGDYMFLNRYSPYSTQVAYQTGSALSPDALSNPHLQWESTRKWSSSLNLGFLNDRILLELVYFRNRSSNQLISESLPLITGFDTIIGNIPAKVQNSGWEFSLDTENIKGDDFSWSSNFNLSLPRNELLAFPNLENSVTFRDLLIGKSIGITRFYNFLGVNTETGLYEFLDRNGNVTSQPNMALDRQGYLDTFPKVYGGFQNSFSYKGFTFHFLFQFAKKVARKAYFDTFNGRPGEFFASSNIANYPLEELNRWRSPGDKAQFQKAVSSFNTSTFNAYQAALNTNFAWMDADYLRLKNVSLSWNLPNKLANRMKVQNLRIYVQGQNLWTITGYKGLDPESANNLGLPPLHVMTLGLQLSL